ncbi:MAG: ATP-binding cassette domain-containing protein [Butyrivibrio sp.]|nr:ATP-binding cassette domain-containing protein [Acetatifactor muris]MCM1558418.1 ATP-binding cassette domain-containing protein [Butyrivibrio sp.]
MELKIENLSKSFGDVKALNHMSATFTPGVYGVLGPNGAGKSTLINLITDNIARQEGQILWNGREILKGNKEYRKILGYMPQQQGYYEDFTAGAFLMYMAHLKGLDRRTAGSRSRELLQIFNLESARNKRIGGFSGGMKQRLLLAQALLNDPELLILDEPTAGVDPQERIHIRNYISQIATNRIVLLATHIVSDIEAIAKEILLLRSGNVIEIDTPGRLIEKVRKYVWNVEIAEAELPDIQARYLISNLRKNEKGLSLKVICEEPPAGAQPEKAVNLDDVYLYYITYT